MSKPFILRQGDSKDVLKLLKANYIDSVVADPPAGINFMGKDFDKDKGGRKQWIQWLTDIMEEVYRVLKPGGYMLIWALPRTSHWTATALEDAGFEIRDVITHISGSGFPKSMNISKAIDKAAGADRKKIATGTSGKTRSVLNAALHPETFGGGYDITIAATDDAKKWEGYGTALKPASEHWILCRKPIEEKTVVANVLKWGVGAINIDASRIGMINGDSTLRKRVGPTYTGTYNNGKVSEAQPGFMTGTDTGRFPANLLLSHSPGCKFVGEKEIKGNSPVGFSDVKTDNTYGKYAHNSRDVTHDLTETVQAYECVDGCPIAEMGEQSRYFKTFVYAGKSSKRDRNLGLTEGETSTHPTVKSQQLMTYLVKMITPPGGKVLDMFMGSGSTGVAAVNNGFKFVGIELDDDYYITAKTRIESAWEKSCNENTV